MKDRKRIALTRLNGTIVKSLLRHGTGHVDFVKIAVSILAVPTKN
jgi:hypothetical protein